MPTGWKCLVWIAMCLLVGVSARSAVAIETSAKQAFLMDFDTGAVLFEKNADTPMAPASMTKMMTAHVVFQRLKDGDLSLQDTMGVSEKAWRKGGSKMFVELDSRVRVDDLLRGIIVQSGNDASIVVAEALAGDEASFAREMNEIATKLGMTGTHFVNSTGWPDPEHVTTAHDLSILAVRTIRDFPEYYRLYQETSFTFNEIRQGNRNPLLYKDLGADGLKTGHTKDSGYGLTGSAVRNGRRLVLVVNGLASVRVRAREAERLLDWGFREFRNYQLFKAGDVVNDAAVWLGESPTVPLTVKDDLTITLPRKARREMRVSTVHEGPIAAPIAAGTVVAKLRVTAPGVETIELPLQAGASVERLGMAGRLTSAVGYLIWGSPAE